MIYVYNKIIKISIYNFILQAVQSPDVLHVLHPELHALIHEVALPEQVAHLVLSQLEH